MKEKSMPQDLKSKDELAQENLELKKTIDSLKSEVLNLKEQNSILEIENKNLKNKKPHDGGIRIEPKIRK
jgi:regulator of replication initiation timing